MNDRKTPLEVRAERQMAANKAQIEATPRGTKSGKPSDYKLGGRKK